MPTITDYLFQTTTTGFAQPAVGVWVRLTNNSTLANFVSNSATDSTGAFTIIGIPPGTYTVATGLAAVGPFTNTTDTSYFIGADVGGVNTFTSALTVQGLLSAASNLSTHGPDPYFDVMFFGAKGDGVTDDSTAIRAAVTAVNATGGTLFFPPGTYIINCNSTVANLATVVGFNPGSGVIVQGAGRGATVLKIKAGQVAGTSGGNLTVSPMMIGSINATDLVIRDLTIDGNGANQSVTSNDGIIIYQCSRVKIERVRVQNVFGAAASEQGCIQAISSTYIGCDTVDCNSSGFPLPAIAFSACTSCWAVNCTATGGASPWRTFVCDGSSQILWRQCYAFLNTDAGVAAFDCNGSVNVRYEGCVAGGVANAAWQSFAVPFPYSSFGQSLGNSGMGWNITDTGAAHAVDVELIDCTANNNGVRGVMVQTSFGPVRIVGGDFSNNAVGLWFSDAARAATTRISGGVRCTGNSTTAMTIGATNYASIFGNVTAPAVPSSGAALTNPFPFDAVVYVNANTGGTTVAIGGAGTMNVAATAWGTFKLPAGQTITPTYTNLPVWVWFLD